MPKTDGIVVITGCDSGIGLATALKFDGLGWRVVAGCLTERGCEQIKEKCSSRASALRLNVVDDGSVEEFAAGVRKLYPTGIDVLINNAGIGGDFFMEMTGLKKYRDIMNVNFFGTVAVTQALVPVLIEKQGRIINIASVAGFSGLPGASAYCASKHAVVAFSQSIAYELSRYNISVVIMAPGTFKTQIIDGASAALQNLFDELSEETQARWEPATLSKLKTGATDVLQFLADDPERCADMLVHAARVRRPKAVYWVGKDSRFGFRFFSYLPVHLRTLLLRLGQPVPPPATKK